MHSLKSRISISCFVGLLTIILSICVIIPRVTFAQTGEQAAIQEKININTATLEELTELKRIGPNLAGRIIQYREENGPFMQTSDILKVKGIGQKFWEANENRITIGEELEEAAKEEIE